MKKIIRVILILSVLSLFLSCASKEESALNKMAELTQKVENAENPEELDWSKLEQEFDAIEKEACECHFSEKESREYFKMKGRYHAAKMKHAIKNFPYLIDKAADAVAGYMEGFMDGFE